MITGKKIKMKMKMCESQSLRSHIFREKVIYKKTLCNFTPLLILI